MGENRRSLKALHHDQKISVVVRNRSGERAYEMEA